MFHNVPHCTWAVSVSELCIQHLQCLLQLCAGAQCNAHRPVLQFERGKKLGRKDRSISALHCCLIFAPWGEQTRRGYPVKAAWKRLTTQRKCILSEQIGVAFAALRSTVRSDVYSRTQWMNAMADLDATRTIWTWKCDLSILARCQDVIFQMYSGQSIVMSSHCMCPLFLIIHNHSEWFIS